MSGRKQTLAAMAVMVSLLCAAEGAAANTTTIDGSPLNIVIADNGDLQAVFDDQTEGVVSPGGSTDGDAGLILAIPSTVSKAGEDLIGGVAYGPAGIVGTGSNLQYVPVSQGAVTGSGTIGSPYSQVTRYDLMGGTSQVFAEVTQTVTHVSGTTVFNVAYAVKNTSGGALAYRATTAARLNAAAGAGTGFFDATSPPLVGALNDALAASLAFEQTPSLPAWSHHMEGSAGSAVVPAITDSSEIIAGGGGLADTVAGSANDPAVAAQWDDHYSSALANAATQNYAVTWKLGGLGMTPLTATKTTGENHSVTVAAVDRRGLPITSKPVRFSVTGANSALGVDTSSSIGTATFGYTGNSAGADTVTAYVDLDNSSTRNSGEPQAVTTVTWNAPPPVDTDGDGVADNVDQCPATFGSLSNGCPPPPPDTDGDGTIDANDQCPFAPGIPPNGCPPAVISTPTMDSDGDGFVDPLDQCPTISGSDSGCPVVVPKNYALRKGTASKNVGNLKVTFRTYAASGGKNRLEVTTSKRKRGAKATIKSVAFSLDGKVLSTDKRKPFRGSAQPTGAPESRHKLTAKVTYSTARRKARKSATTTLTVSSRTLDCDEEKYEDADVGCPVFFGPPGMGGL